MKSNIIKKLREAQISNEGAGETAGDFSDDDSAMPLSNSASPQRSTTNIFGLPHTVPVQTSLERRLEKLNADLADAEEKAERVKVENQDKIDALKAASDIAMDQVVAKIEKLQQTIITQQAALKHTLTPPLFSLLFFCNS